MKYIYQGSQSGKRFSILLSFTGITSESMIGALRDHLVIGLSDSTAAVVNGVKPSNFSRDLAKLNDVAARIERVKEIDEQRRIIK